MQRLRSLLTLLLLKAATGLLRTPRCAARTLRAAATKPLRATATEEAFDVVVIGSGIGGLSCAGLLAAAGKSVCVLEALAPA